MQVIRVGNQNNIILITGNQIQKQIVSDVAKNEYFSILADETSDMRQTEQLSLMLTMIPFMKISLLRSCFIS